MFQPVPQRETQAFADWLAVLDAAAAPAPRAQPGREWRVVPTGRQTFLLRRRTPRAA